MTVTAPAAAAAAAPGLQVVPSVGPRGRDSEVIHFGPVPPNWSKPLA